MRPNGPRDPIVGPDSGPEPPFPLRMRGQVISGFGRGSKELGIPTANLPVTNAPWINTASSGVYFGWAGIQFPATHPSHPTNLLDTDADADANADDATTRAPSPPPVTLVPEAARRAGWRLFPFVMSIGYNPFYKNTVRSAEVHILHRFPHDFYGCDMAIAVCAFIRPEFDYVSVESLVADIREDIEVARRSLDRPAWRDRLADPFLWGADEVEKEERAHAGQTVNA
ncbi:MAG: riboflavin kinase [Claussenomyces sp. TS43310]|nr:MAG: riboflavin kinase [Claussenomyces sp. TS43310]